MTHDELIAKINTHPTRYVESALRAVVEVLGKGFDFSEDECCMRGFDQAKHKVIQAIEKELG